MTSLASLPQNHHEMVLRKKPGEEMMTRRKNTLQNPNEMVHSRRYGSEKKRRHVLLIRVGRNGRGNKDNKIILQEIGVLFERGKVSKRLFIQHNDTTDGNPPSIPAILSVRFTTVRIQCTNNTIAIERARTQFRPIPKVIHLRKMNITSAKWNLTHCGKFLKFCFSFCCVVDITEFAIIVFI